MEPRSTDRLAERGFLLRWSWICLAGCVLAACTAGPEPECSADRDCGSDGICLDGVCRDLNRPCDHDGQCLTGQVCMQGLCAAACQADHQCPAGTWCDRGRCEAGCRTDADCPIGSLCTLAAHRCDPGCSGPGQCPLGQRCSDGQCRPAECVADADCLAPLHCLAGLCSLAGCATNTDCPYGQRCSDGACVLPECHFNLDCPAGLVCTDGLCVARTGCVVDMDCPLGQRCASGQCVALGCAGDADCPSGQRCFDGQCSSRECLRDEHCPAGQACRLGVCEPSAACDWIAQDCAPGLKCTPDPSGQPVCEPAGDGSDCLAQVADDCPAGQLCTGYTGFACHDLCLTPSGAGCAAGMRCAPIPAVPGLGTCECDPMVQACGAGLRCAFDPASVPICQPAGDGSACFAGGLDDCPAGMLCATADGQAYDCFDVCLTASGAGCWPYYTCYGVDGLAEHGLCVPDCHPVRQDCAGAKCTLDEYSAPICWAEQGSGAACRAGVQDDCPAGQVCGHDGQAWACRFFCILYNAIGCQPDQTCAALDDSPHWGACL